MLRRFGKSRIPVTMALNPTAKAHAFEFIVSSLPGFADVTLLRAAAQAGAISVLNLEALDHVDPKVRPYLPTAYLDRQFWISDEWYAEHGNRAAELWNAWMLKKT